MTGYAEAKRAEEALYDNVYRTKGNFASEAIRSTFLIESEQAFCDLIKSCSPGATILEIGCGRGEISRLAYHCGGNVLGIDISKEAIKYCKAEAEALNAAAPKNSLAFEVCDIDHLDNSIPKYDLIIDREVFSSISFVEAIPRLASLLKPGGRLIVLECLGHNPIFNLNRTIGVLLGRRSKWAAKHIFKLQDIKTAQNYFSKTVVQYFHLFVFAALPLRIIFGKRLIDPLEKKFRALDSKIKNGSLLSRMAFKVVVEFQK